MKTTSLLASVLAIPLLHASDLPGPSAPPPNRLIDYAGFLSEAAQVGKLRDQHRVSEADFLRMASDPATIVLDARSDAKYHLLHIVGARHLDIAEDTAADLAKVIPDKNTRILIYCNNNFLREPAAFASKVPTASLNIYTFNTLYAYGYRNVYELGPLIDINTSKLAFAGTLAAGLKSTPR